MEQKLPETRTRRSCWYHGYRVSAVLFFLMAMWIVSGFFIWKKCTIPLPDKSGSIIYMARLNKILCAEWDRKVRLKTKRFQGKELTIPGDPSGADPVNVYWHQGKDKDGPYLVFRDPVYAYAIDLKQGTTVPDESYIYSEQSRYIGRVEYPFNHYVPVEESPERKLQKQ